MLKLKVTAGANGFEIETESPLSDVARYLDLWFSIVGSPDDAEAIRAQIARLNTAGGPLKAAVDANQ